MSMTLKQAIKRLRQYQGYEPGDYDQIVKHNFDLSDETVDALLFALRPITQEQVEKAWEKCQHFRVCGTCKVCVSGRYQQANFCAVCGAPLTDEAVQMVMKRMEALHETTE